MSGKKSAFVPEQDSDVLYTNRYSMRPVEGLRRVADAAVGQYHFMAVAGVLRPQISNVMPPGGGPPTLVALCDRALQQQVDIKYVYLLLIVYT